MFKKLISLFLSFTLIFTQPLFAQGVAQLNLGSYLSTVGQSIATDRFRPLHMRYFSYDLKADNFQLLLDKGDNKDIKEPELQEKTKVLMEYFQIGLSLPNDKFWVNLRPDAQDEMIDPELEKTDMGKIMLEADLQLKRDTAQATSPQTPEGKAYWDKLYKKAGELFGTENITIPTITRPWIVPGEVILRQGEDSAYIFKANMKVLLEEDYLKSHQDTKSQSHQYNFNDPRMKELNEYSTQLIRELIIPRLTKEVNSSKRYASLRQVFFSLVMARWFKDTYKDKPGQYSKLIDSHNLTNLTSKEAWDKTYYFNEYKKSFEQGEYNLKENITTPTGQVIRSYVSGGITGSSSAMTENTFHNVNNDDKWHPDVVLAGYEQPPDSRKQFLLIKYTGGERLEEAGAGSALIMNSNLRPYRKDDLEDLLGQLLKAANTYEKIEPLKKIEEWINKLDVDKLRLVDIIEIMVNEIPENVIPYFAEKNEKAEEETSVTQTAASIIKHIAGLEIPNKPVSLVGGTASRGFRIIFLSEGHIKEIFSSIKEGIESSPEPYLASEALGVILFMAAESKITVNRIISLTYIGKLAELLLRPGTSQKIKKQFLEQVKEDIDIDAIEAGHSEIQVETQEIINNVKASLTALKESAGSALMEAMDSLSFEQMEKMRRLERRLWVIVDNIEEILDEEELSRRQNKGEIKIAEDGFKGIHRMLAYLNTLNRKGARIEIKEGVINEITEMFSKIGLVDILPEEYKVYSGSRLLTLSGIISELKRLQEDWEKLGISMEGVVKMITRRIGYAAETNIKLIVNAFREKINRNPTVEEVGEIIGNAFRNPKGNESLPEIVNKKISELKQKASSAMESSKIPKNTGGIDFRAMNYLVQPMGSFKDLRFGLPTLTSSALERIDLDKELASLRDMVKAGMVPSGERVKEYLAACFQKGKIEEKQDDLLVCLAEIYRLAEEENLETSPELRESLVIVDTGKFVLLPDNQKVGLS